jgi:hypothetical protein
MCGVENFGRDSGGTCPVADPCSRSCTLRIGDRGFEAPRGALSPTEFRPTQASPQNNEIRINTHFSTRAPKALMKSPYISETRTLDCAANETSCVSSDSAAFKRAGCCAQKLVELVRHHLEKRREVPPYLWSEDCRRTTTLTVLLPSPNSRKEGGALLIFFSPEAFGNQTEYQPQNALLLPTVSFKPPAPCQLWTCRIGKIPL